MKKLVRILIIMIVMLFLAFILFSIAINDGKSVKEEAYLEAQEIAEKNAGMVTYSDFYMYRGNEAWDVIVGQDADGNEIGVWIPVESTNEEEAAGEAPADTTSEGGTVEEAPVEEDASSDGTQQGYILPMDGYITEQEAVEIATVGKDVKEIVSVNLGMENEVVLWEITCINSKDNYCYYYINADTGQVIKSYENI